ncbi:transmembrane protein 253 isoform X1 [Ambystoma mexicanum]|uniref:transmembrane protein 253 isoform X1 n=1 Tax=Ambystoma mexicanum TaxID=8296 RepID=UPI0037E753DA
MKDGTVVIMDHYWACGSRAYMKLPRDWAGLCSIVIVHVPALVIPKSDLNNGKFPKPDAHLRKNRLAELLNQKKRENYFSARLIEAFDAIPYEHKLFSKTASVFIVICMPGIQEMANAKCLQISRWELLQMINTTIKGFNAIKEELRAIRLMTIQNRYVLDMITAMDGGVCAKMGESCRTFIPSHDYENSTLTEAITLLTNLHIKMEDEVEDIADDSWFASIFSWVSQWMVKMFKFLGALLMMIMFGFGVIRIIIAQCKKTAKKAVGMKIVIDVESVYKPKDLTDEEIRDYVKASIHAPEGTMFLYPENHKKYVGRWIYCIPKGQCSLMTWSVDEHVKSAGCLKGFIKIWTPKKHFVRQGCLEVKIDERVVDESPRRGV